MRHPMVYSRNAMLKIIVQIMCHTHRNNFKYVAHQYTMYSRTPCLGMRFSWAGVNQEKRTRPTYCGWHLQLEGFPNLSSRWNLSCSEEPDNQVVKEIVKADHVPYFESDFSCAIFCKTEWFLSMTNPEQPLYLQPNSGLPQMRCDPTTSYQIWLWEISLPVFAITLLSYVTGRWNQQLKPLGPRVSPSGLQQWEDSHICLRSAMGSAGVMQHKVQRQGHRLSLKSTHKIWVRVCSRKWSGV